MKSFAIVHGEYEVQLSVCGADTPEEALNIFREDFGYSSDEDLPEDIKVKELPWPWK
jgi:hypothetical protein